MKYKGMPSAMWFFGKAATFTRKYTLASGGPYCDCGYKKNTWRNK